MSRSQVAFAFMLGVGVTMGWQSLADIAPPRYVPAPTPQGTSARPAKLEAAPGSIATVIPLEKAEYRRAPNGRAGIHFLARGANAFVGRLEMDPGGKVPEHRDPTEEYIHVLSGSGTMYIDGVKYAVTPGTTVFMPANAKVSFDNGDTPFAALQVFAGPGPAAKYDAWTRADKR